ncbi:MAG: VWA domain-containing protein [Bacteroidetes bacterium]|nr:MAG: VWA domain-containing protein [Bacteroidota bacterium]
MIDILRFTLAAFLLMPVCVFSQPLEENMPTCRACIAYLNESIHVLKEIRRPLEAFNLHLNQAYGRTVPSSYAQTFRVESIDDNQRYFIDDLCYRLPQAESPLDNLELWYARAMREVERLAPAKADSISRQLESMHEVIQELVQTCGQLQRLTEKKAYLKEAHFESSYRLLLRCEQLFDTFEWIKAGLHKQLQPPVEQYPASLQPLLQAYQATRQLLQALRQRDSLLAVAAMGDFSAAYQGVRESAADFLANPQEFPHHHAETFSFLTKYLGRIEQLGKACLANAYPEQEARVADIFPYEAYGQSAYYYNEIIGMHNHHYVGFTYFLNKCMEHPLTPLPPLAEEPYWYQVIVPDTHPLLRSKRPDSPKPPEVSKSALADAPPANLIFLLDVSGSMKHYSRMPLLKQAFVRLLEQLRPGDQVSIITYSGEARVVLPATPAAARAQIAQAIESLDGQGKTHATKGVKLAYKYASQTFIPGGTNRIILATDGDLEGVFNMKKWISDYAEKGISMSVFYFGNKTPELELRFNRFVVHTHGNFRHIESENADRILLEEAKGIKLN